jgi:hypothetical protein
MTTSRKTSDGVEVAVRDTLSRPAAAWQQPAAPRQDGYDQIPACIQQREDLASGAKRLYGLLQSVHRLKWEPDYRWLAAELAASVRSIIRWVQQLVAAGLIAVRRRGQGLTNLFVVLALVTSGDDAVAAVRVTGWQRSPSTPFNKKNEGKKPDIRAERDYFSSREGRIAPRA